MNDLDLNILKYFCNSKRFLIEILSKIDDKFIYNDSCSTIFKVISKYFTKFKDIPSKELLIEILGGNDLLEEELLLKINDIYNTNNNLNPGDLGYFIKLAQERYNLDVIKNGANDLISNVNNLTVNNLNKKIKQIVNDINIINKSNVFEQGSIGESAILRWNKYKEIEANPTISRGVLSGYSELDKHTNGLKDSELLVVAGPTGTGKSIFMMNVAVNAWLGGNNIDFEPQQFVDNGKNVLYISVEMPKIALEKRIDSNISAVPLYHIRDGSCSDLEKTMYLKSLKFQAEYEKQCKKFYILDMARNASVSMLEAQYESILSTFEPDLVVVDYLGIMKPNNPTGIDWIDQGNIAAEMHEFARTYKKPVISAAQLTKTNLNSNQAAKVVFDPERVARSKMISDNVNVMLQIEKTPDFNISSYLKLHLVKNRDGESGKIIELIKEYWRMKIVDSAVDNII